MSILSFDQPETPRSGKSLKIALGAGAIALVVAVASTLAANININAGPVEFGQGVAQTTACDDAITLSPVSSFVNSSDTSSAGSFLFSGIQVSDIDSSVGKCQGKTLSIKAYGDTDTVALDLYTVHVADTGFLSGDGTITDSGIGTSSSSFILTFNSPTVSASDVYKITIESSDGYGGVALGDQYFDNESIYIKGIVVDENGDTNVGHLGSFLENSGMPRQVFFHNLPKSDPDFWTSAIPLTNGAELAIGIAFGETGTSLWNNYGTQVGIACNSYEEESITLEHFCPGDDSATLSGTVDVNYSKLLTIPGTEITYGSVTSTVQVTIAGELLEIRNIFTLDRTSQFLKVATRVKNLGSNTLTNLRAWALNGDQMIGPSDGDSANLSLVSVSDSGLHFLDGSSEDGFDANGIGAHNDFGSALMYSSTADAAVLNTGCCSLGNLINTDPSVGDVGALETDGSYGLYFRLQDLGPGASHEFTWFFGATMGESSSLASAMRSASRADVYRP